MCVRESEWLHLYVNVSMCMSAWTCVSVTVCAGACVTHTHTHTHTHTAQQPTFLVVLRGSGDFLVLVSHTAASSQQQTLLPFFLHLLTHTHNCDGPVADPIHASSNTNVRDLACKQESARRPRPSLEEMFVLFAFYFSNIPVCAATLRQKLQIKFTILSSHSVLTPGQLSWESRIRFLRLLILKHMP